MIQKMNPRLTIVMPLKGRPLFTLRFLWHANKARLPYRFILADGQVLPELANVLEDSRKIFPNIDVEYIRYPDDLDYGYYFAKMLDATQRVCTPYVMFVDNDDFLLFTGIEQSLEFLEANQEYVCCGGGIGGLSVYARRNALLAGLTGPLNQLSFRYMPYDRSLELRSSSVVERLMLGLRNTWSWYAVYRTPAQLTIRREVVEMNLRDCPLHDKFCAMRTLTLGKARSERATISYMRQYWTSMQPAFAGNDWVHHLMRSRFNAEFSEIMRRVSALAAETDGVEPNLVSQKLRAALESWFTEFLVLNYGPYAQLRGYLRARVPGLLEWAKGRRRYTAAFKRRRIVATLQKYGASADYIKAFSTELAQIEDAIAGYAFEDFIQPYVPIVTGIHPHRTL